MPDLQTYPKYNDYGFDNYLSKAMEDYSNDLSVDETLYEVANKRLVGGTLKIGSANEVVKSDSNGLYIGHNEFDNAPFRVNMAGKFFAESGEINIGGVPLYYPFTFGENIAANLLVCFKPADLETISDGGDTWINEDTPDTNYSAYDYYEAGIRDISGSDTNRTILIKFTKPTEFPYQAIFNFTIQSLSDTDNITYNIKPITSSFDPTTVTWNTKPSLGTTLVSYDPSVESTGTFNKDITGGMRKIDIDGTTIYGIAIQTDTTNATINVYNNIRMTPDSATISYYKSGSNGKVYLADNTDYLTCARVVGKTIEAKNTNEEGKVQLSGVFDDITTTGTGHPQYLKTAGTMGRNAEAAWLDRNNWNLEVGMALSATDLLFQPRKPRPFWIESLSGGHTEGNAASVLYPVPWASQALIEYSFGGGAAQTHDKGYLWIYRTAKGVGNFNTKDSYNDTNKGNHINFNWDGNENTITFEATLPSGVAASITAYIFE